MSPCGAGRRRWPVLCHDIGKPIADLSVTNQDGTLTWSPMHETLLDWAAREGLDIYVVWPQGGDEVVALLAADRVPGIPRHPDTLADLLIERDYALPPSEGDGARRYWRPAPAPLARDGNLVRAFCFAGNRLLGQDPTWARDLAHEAARWNPQNPHPWSLLARALAAEGDWHRAQAVYWHARRRFPHKVQSHSQLGRALILHGTADLGESVYRAAIALFPNDPYCRAELAHALRITGDGERAVEVYGEAQQHFPRNPAIVIGLADTLIDLERLGEADKVMDWADHLDMDDKNPTKHDQVRGRLQQAMSGQPIRLKQTRRPNEGPAGDLDALADITGEDLTQDPALGRATLLRRVGGAGLERAWSEIQTLPAGTTRLVETALWHAQAQGWRAAADWFDPDLGALWR